MEVCFDVEWEAGEGTEVIAWGGLRDGDGAPE